MNQIKKKIKKFLVLRAKTCNYLIDDSNENEKIKAKAKVAKEQKYITYGKKIKIV